MVTKTGGNRACGRPERHGKNVAFRRSPGCQSTAGEVGGGLTLTSDLAGTEHRPGGLVPRHHYRYAFGQALRAWVLFSLPAPWLQTAPVSRRPCSKLRSRVLNCWDECAGLKPRCWRVPPIFKIPELFLDAA